MITLIGDVHGKYDKYLEITSKHKYTIQLGDLGFNYDVLKGIDNTRHLILLGNHDNYDACYNHAHFLYDYGYTRLNAVDFFYYRGAYSIDRQDRTIGIDWWENEEVKIDEFMKARELYRQIKPNIMISHDCPSDVVEHLLKPNQRRYENITGWALNELFHIHQPKLWFFGHHHKSWQMNINGTDFRCLNELETYILTKDSY
jgi:hypothetical protein